MKPACKDCFWWVQLPQKEEIQGYGGTVTIVHESPSVFGHCHLRPPISGKQPWPQTLAQDFCRCFKDKESDADSGH